jgi:hypothetical protein
MPQTTTTTLPSHPAAKLPDGINEIDVQHYLALSLFIGFVVGITGFARCEVCRLSPSMAANSTHGCGSYVLTMFDIVAIQVSNVANSIDLSFSDDRVRVIAVEACDREGRGMVRKAGEAWLHDALV